MSDNLYYDMHGRNYDYDHPGLKPGYDTICIMINGRWKYVLVSGRQVSYGQLVEAAGGDSRYHHTITYQLPDKSCGEVAPMDTAPVVGGAVYTVTSSIGHIG